MHPTTMTGQYPRATLAATILGSSLAFIDGSVVNVALPALARELSASPSALSWAINAYLLPVGALILLGGGLGDHFGRRMLFQIGLLLFTLASAACAAAPSFEWLLATRGMQGIGAALLVPNSLAILGGAFSGEARGRAIGTWAAAGALAGALGPVLGGWLVDAMGWRTIFLINLPLAAGAGYLAWKYVDEQMESRRDAPLDSVGAGLATAALGLLTWALTKASESHAPSSLSWAAMVVGFAVLAVFVWHEHRRGDQALMPLALFHAPTFVGLNLLTFFLYGSLSGLVVLLPYFLIRLELWPATVAGAALLPIPIFIAVGSRLMGQVASRHGGRLPLVFGSLLVAVGLALYARIANGSVGYWTHVLPPTLLVALGMGACVAPLTTAVIASVNKDHVGIASGFNNAVARIAGLIATASLSFVFIRQGSAEDFVIAFRIALVVGAASAVVAAAFALLLVDRVTADPELK